jgi:lysophospholipase L1-like esterase
LPAQSGVSTFLATPDVPSLASRACGRRAALGYLALALPGWLVMAGSVRAFVGGWRPDGRLELFAVTLAAAWLAITSLPLARVRGRRVYATWCPQFVLLAAALAIAWVVAELALPPLLVGIQGPFHGRRPGTEIEYRPLQDIMPGVGPVAHVRFNSLGIRGIEPPPRDEAYRILCLGGSSTACTYLDDAKTWPTRLADDLQRADPQHKYWVGNAGIPGFRSEQHLEFLERSPLVEAVDCLIVQAGINDFMACLAGPRPASPLWTQSSVWKLARAVVRPSSRGGTQVEDASGRVYERRRAMRRSAAISSEPPPLDSCLPQFAERIEQMIDVCQRRAVRLVFTTQATLWREAPSAADDALLWFGQLADGRFLAVGQLRSGMDRYNQALKEVCERRGVGLVDLSALDGQSEAFYDDCHYTEVGAARAANLIATWLVAHPADRKAGGP